MKTYDEETLMRIALLARNINLAAFQFDAEMQFFAPESKAADYAKSFLADSNELRVLLAVDLPEER